jgi:hypothetical protein
MSLEIKDTAGTAPLLTVTSASVTSATTLPTEATQPLPPATSIYELSSAQRTVYADKSAIKHPNRVPVMIHRLMNSTVDAIDVTKRTINIGRDLPALVGASKHLRNELNRESLVNHAAAVAAGKVHKESQPKVSSSKDALVWYVLLFDAPRADIVVETAALAETSGTIGLPGRSVDRHAMTLLSSNTLTKMLPKNPEDGFVHLAYSGENAFG